MNNSNEISITESDFRSRYQYEEADLLGEGGFAQVYKAFDKQFQEYVALKFYSKGEAGKYDVLHEMKDTRKFSHPNIIRIHDAFVVRFEHAGIISYVQVGILEFANAGNLRDFVNSKPSEKEFISVLVDILKGLKYLHEDKKIIHRDLSPENILMFREGDNWIPKIADFGISKKIDFVTDAQSKNKSTQLVGKVDYMAPEQFYPEKYGIDGKISTNVDLWAFGVILYELFFLKLPFGVGCEDNPIKIIQSIVHDSVANLDSVPDPYKSVIKKCLDKNAANRVKSEDILMQILQHNKINKPLDKPVKTLEIADYKVRKKVNWKLGIGLLFFLLLVGLAYFIINLPDPTPPGPVPIRTPDSSIISPVIKPVPLDSPIVRSVPEPNPKKIINGLYPIGKFAARKLPANGAVDLVSIEITDALSIITLKLRSGNSMYFSSPGNHGAFYLSAGDKQYPLKDITGVQTGTFVIDDKDRILKLSFKRLPEYTERFDLINGDNQFHNDFTTVDFKDIVLK